jgi:hypothetical protein
LNTSKAYWRAKTVRINLTRQHASRFGQKQFSLGGCGTCPEKQTASPKPIGRVDTRNHGNRRQRQFLDHLLTIPIVKDSVQANVSEKPEKSKKEGIEMGIEMGIEIGTKERRC